MKRATLLHKMVLALVATGMLVVESQADVTARFSRGTLTLTGDSFGDFVEINGESGGTTVPNLINVSINGGPSVEYLGVANLKIDMKAGEDEVRVGFIEISGNLDIRMGGDMGDRCLVGLCGIGGNYSSQGFSETAAVLMTVGGNMTLKTGSAFDMDGDGYSMFVVAVGVGGRARIDGGRSADDNIIVGDCEFDSDLSVNLGGGDDEVKLDRNVIGRNLSTDGGSGYDILFRERYTVGGRITSRRLEVTFDLS